MERWENKVEEAPFSNVTPCEGCGGAPPGVFYGESREDDLFLCQQCAVERYCEDCHVLFDSGRGLKIHRGKVH